MHRRAFLWLIGVGTAIAHFFPRAIASAKNIIAIGLDKATGVENVGGHAIVKVEDHTLILIRENEKKVRALNAICTHEQCEVGYNPEAKRIECPCHGSKYDLNGQNVEGPAPKPLDRYAAKLHKGKIYVQLN